MKALHAELHHLRRDNCTLRELLLFLLRIAISFLNAHEGSEDAMRLLSGLTEQLIFLMETAAVSGNEDVLASAVAEMKVRLANVISAHHARAG